jgi:L-asparaginase/Glu-tRNA(Gln) amidotransferase subunit D
VVWVAGSQLPLSMPRSDARQNLIDSLTCATSFFTPPHTQLQEVAVCFGGRLMRGNRTQKVRSHTQRSLGLSLPLVPDL